MKDSIVDLAQRLVRIPSRGGADPPEPVAEAAASWLKEHGIAPSPLRNPEGRLIGLSASVLNGPGPHYVLNATLDTAGFGDESTWTLPPTSGEVREGWLYGRGSADSKMGISIFCHVASRLAREGDKLKGSLSLLFDADEHTGGFAGAKAYFVKPLDGVFIGYPGNEEIAIGSRGFLRAVITVWGHSAHSGASRKHGVNAIHRCADLAQRFSSLDLGTSPDFPLPPKLTMTGMQGGGEFSLVPDQCKLAIDLRLTPAFDADAARARIETEIRTWEAPDGLAPTQIDWHPGWPAYRLPEDHPMVRALQQEAATTFGRPIPAVVVGPSNIGNYLAQIGIPAICGFGVTASGVHGPDERVEIASIEPVAQTYFRTLERLLR